MIQYFKIFSEGGVFNDIRKSQKPCTILNRKYTIFVVEALNKAELLFLFGKINPDINIFDIIKDKSIQPNQQFAEVLNTLIKTFQANQPEKAHNIKNFVDTERNKADAQSWIILKDVIRDSVVNKEKQELVISDNPKKEKGKGDTLQENTKYSGNRNIESLNSLEIEEVKADGTIKSNIRYISEKTTVKEYTKTSAKKDLLQQQKNMEINISDNSNFGTQNKEKDVKVVTNSKEDRDPQEYKTLVKNQDTHIERVFYKDKDKNMIEKEKFISEKENREYTTDLKKKPFTNDKVHEFTSGNSKREESLPFNSNKEKIHKVKEENIFAEFRNSLSESEKSQEVGEAQGNPREHVQVKMKRLHIKSEDVNIMLRVEKDRLAVSVKSENIMPNNISFIDKNRLLERIHNLGFEIEILSINGVQVISKSEKALNYNKKGDRTKESLKDEISNKKDTHSGTNIPDFSLFL